MSIIIDIIQWYGPKLEVFANDTCCLLGAGLTTLGYPAWPGYIYDPEHLDGNLKDLALRNPKKQCLVYFYETGDL